MKFELLGWSDEDVTLGLDYREFSYAGKFGTADTGKAVLTESGEVLAAASFSPDRTDEGHARIRYVSVREDRRGERLGPSLLVTLRSHLLDHGFDEVAIAVNNPYAYQAAYRAGFVWTGEESGIAELTLRSPASADAEAYRNGLRRFLERGSLSESERSFIVHRQTARPPRRIDPPADWQPDSA